MFKSVVDKSTGFFAKFFAIGSGVSMFAVFLIIFFNSIRRYGFDKSFEWGEELPIYIAIYGIMFGIAWAYMLDKHIRFTIVTDFIPKKIGRVLNFIVDISVIVVGVLLTYSGYLFAQKRGGLESSGLINSAYDISEATGVEWIITFGEMYPYQLAISIGGAMLAIAALCRFLNRFYEDISIEECKGLS